MTQSSNKPRLINHKSKLLGEEENRHLFQIIGNRCVSLSTAVVQLLLAEPPMCNEWMKKLSGIATFVKDNQKRSYFIRIYDLQNTGCIWEQEIYNQFKYNDVHRYFHTFDTDNCPAGLNFANEEEARSFSDAIQEKLTHRRARRNERKQRVSTNNRKSMPGGGLIQPSVQRSPIPSSGSVSSLSSVSDTPVSFKKKDKDKKKKKLTKTDIGSPSDFRHVGHVGWDPSTGAFDTDNLDPNLKKLFDDAGISEQQLQDEDTAKFIYDFIENRGGLDALKQPQEKRPPARVPTSAPPVPQPTVPSQTIPSSGPPPPPSRIGQMPTRNLALPHQRAATAPPPPPSRAPMKTPMAAPPPPPPSRVVRLPPPAMAPSAIHSMPPPAFAPPPPPRAPSAAVSRPPANVPPPPPPAMAPPPIAIAPPPPVAVAPPPPPPPGLGYQDDVQSPRSDMLSQIRGGAALKHVDPTETEPATPDSRGQLLNQIRGGFNLKQVDAVERPPSTAADDGLAGALARALAMRANRIQEDDDDDEEDDDDWSE